MSYVLATSLNDVDEYLRMENSERWLAIDTEATALDTRRAKLVGISLSLAAETAIYIPIGHRIGTNLPLEPVWERIAQKLEEYTAVFFNAKYDLNILQKATKNAAKIERFEDVLELVYLADPDRKTKGLKVVARDDLGFAMEKFEDLFTEAEKKAKIYDISTKSPQRCLNYASADADATFRARKHFDWVAKEFSMAVKIDNKLIDIVRRIEHNGGMELNREYIDEQIKMLDARAEALREQIHRVVGYQFEINSPKQLGIALFEKMGIPSPGMTKTKNPIHITKEEVLEKLKGTYPIVELVISYRKVVKARSSYFLKLAHLAERGIKPRFSFNMFAAPTFRFAAPGGDPDVDGFTGVNIQAVSNGEAREILGVDLTAKAGQDDYIEQVDEEDILIDLRQEIEVSDEELGLWDGEAKDLPYVIETEAGNYVCIRETCKSCPALCMKGGIDVIRRTQKNVKMIPSVRQAFRAPAGWKLVSFDYDRQELVIGANMSQEPKWLRALAANEDLHEITAAAAYGMPVEKLRELEKTNKEEYKRKRGVGKTLNFAIFYGATAYTLMNKADLSKAAAEQLYDGFVKGHPTLMSWINKVHIFAKKNGYTTTYFGRRRNLSQFYNSDLKGMIGFANRSAVNTAIQGTAAEVTRIAMVKVDRRLKDDGFSWNEVRPAMQIHDELAYLVRDELVKEVAPRIKDSMEFKVKSWQVQLSAGLKIGDVWGNQMEIKNFEEWRLAA